jgi:integrase
MAYAERRGKTFRARYRRPDGTWGSSPYGDDGKPFLTRTAAERYGDAQEADIRRNRWADPNAGDILLHLEEVTLAGYKWHIEVHILPDFGERPLRSLTTLEITAWELRLHRSGICGETSARSARTLLHTILSDAVSAGHLQANPAVRQRNRGRKNCKSRTRGREQVWATPLQVLLLAERLSALSGRPDDMVMALTIAYTGMRWGEVTGLERPYFRLSAIRVDQQLYEHNGR